MAKERRPPQEFIKQITVSDDGLKSRDCHEWTRIKLGILVSYLQAYGTACARAGRFYLVDAMAGPGLCSIKETGEHLLGSTPVALQSQPPFAKVLSLEFGPANVAALKSRTAKYGARAVVEQGDCNQDLERLMLQHIPRRAPVFVLLDPEGAELEWQTIEAVARFREGDLKAEVLILFATEGVNRMLPVEADIDEQNAARLDWLFPRPCDWRSIWDARRRGEITPAQARLEYVEGYMTGVRGLGYRHVLRREVTRSSGSLVYHLVFATDHAAGEAIMADVFAHMNPNEPQLPLL